MRDHNKYFLVKNHSITQVNHIKIKNEEQKDSKYIEKEFSCEDLVRTYCQFQLIRNKKVKEYWNEEKYITEKLLRSMNYIHKKKL